MRRIVCWLSMAMTFAASGVGFGAPEQGPMLETRTLKIGDVARSYHLYLPRTLTPAKPAPLILAFHGRGREGSGVAFAKTAGLNEAAAPKGFLVAYPDGIAGKWLDGGLTSDPRYGKDVEFAASVIDDVAKRHPIDPKRTFATGFSNGAAFSYLLAIRLSDRIAAIAAVGANMSRDFLKEMKPGGKPVSLLQFVGSNDPFCGRDKLHFDYLISHSENRDAWIRYNGCANGEKRQALPAAPLDHDLPEASVWSGSAGSEVAIMWLEGAGHGWPIRMARGNTLNPSAMICEFFARHAKR